jgi:hypothetical protein
MNDTEPEGAAPASVTGHPFVPARDWWTQCEMCGLSEAAHQTTTLCAMCGGLGTTGGPDADGNYDPCDRCEGTGRRP